MEGTKAVCFLTFIPSYPAKVVLVLQLKQLWLKSCYPILFSLLTVWWKHLTRQVELDHTSTKIISALKGTLDSDESIFVILRVCELNNSYNVAPCLGQAPTYFKAISNNEVNEQLLDMDDYCFPHFKIQRRNQNNLGQSMKCS